MPAGSVAADAAVVAGFLEGMAATVAAIDVQAQMPRTTDLQQRKSPARARQAGQICGGGLQGQSSGSVPCRSAICSRRQARSMLRTRPFYVLGEVINPCGDVAGGEGIRQQDQRRGQDDRPRGGLPTSHQRR